MRFKFYKQDPIEQHKSLEGVKLFQKKVEYILGIVFTIIVSLAILGVIVAAAINAIF